MREPKVDCPVCSYRVGLNTYAASGSPRINTHALRGTTDECPGSRCWVSQRTYDNAARKAA